jgi:hypothetical protein
MLAAGRVGRQLASSRPGWVLRRYMAWRYTFCGTIAYRLRSQSRPKATLAAARARKPEAAIVSLRLTKAWLVRYMVRQMA